jgi:hypothetical protein
VIFCSTSFGGGSAALGYSWLSLLAPTPRELSRLSCKEKALAAAEAIARAGVLES